MLKQCKSLLSLIFAFENKDNVKKLKILRIPVFSKKQLEDLTTYYLFGVPVISVEEKLEYDGGK